MMSFSRSMAATCPLKGQEEENKNILFLYTRYHVKSVVKWNQVEARRRREKARKK